MRPGRLIRGQKQRTLLEHLHLNPVFGGVSIANYLSFMCYAFFSVFVFGLWIAHSWLPLCFSLIFFFTVISFLW
jgi:hypothetical protein